MRLAAFVVVLLTALVQTSAAFAHASLVRAEPADGALVARAAGGAAADLQRAGVAAGDAAHRRPTGRRRRRAATAENTTVTVTPPALRRGTHVLSWRVISADGHPVGGSLVFSVGEASAAPVPGALPAGDPAVRSALWAAKVVDLSGALHRRSAAHSSAPGCWRTRPPWLDRIADGADRRRAFRDAAVGRAARARCARSAAVRRSAQRLVWETGLETSYGLTAIAAMVALFAGLFAFEARRRAVARALVAGRACSAPALALALSGHASNAAPQWLTRPSVFVHVVCVAFWIGALLPLIAAVRTGEGDAALARFTRVDSLSARGAGAQRRSSWRWCSSTASMRCGRRATASCCRASSRRSRRCSRSAAVNRYVLVPRYRHEDAARRGR